MHRERANQGPMEDRARTPIRGVRQRLRVAIKAASPPGVRFATDFARRPVLHLRVRVKAGPAVVAPDTFEGYRVVVT